MGFSAQGMVALFKELGDGIVGVEVGVCKGENIKALLDNCPNIAKIYGVDPWVAYQDKLTITQATADEWYALTKKNLKGYWYDNEVELIRKPSLQAVKLFSDNSFEFVYIDGDHSFAAALNDMRAWWPKVKPGGLLCGHDYRAKDKEVRAAVEKFTEDNKFEVEEAKYWSWYIRKEYAKS